MCYQYPLRIDSHQLEEASHNFFVSLLPRAWMYEKPSNDYGVDLRVELVKGQMVTGLELMVQLKSSAEESRGDYETAKIKTKTYNYLWDKLQVVMIVKYVESENKAYWQFLSDVPEPNQEKKTFSVLIPKENSLQEVDWGYIYEYLQKVTDEKLAYVRRRRI